MVAGAKVGHLHGEQPSCLPGALLAVCCFLAGGLASSAWRATTGPAAATALGGPLLQSTSREALLQYATTAEDFAVLGAAARVSASVPPWLFARPEALAVAHNPPTPPSPEDKALMTAQDWEDDYAHKNFFAGRRNGLILESGALDGVQFSVSNFFVRARGWRAVHVEGSPHSFEALARNRPESLNINAAICSRLAPLHYVSRAEGANGGAAGGFWEFLSGNM